MNYCAEFPEEKTYSEKEYHESLNRLTHAATEIKNLNREINELRNELEQTKKELETEKRYGALRMTIQEKVDAWCVEPSTGSDPKDAEILTKRILHAVVPFCKQA
ncbi:hypothetical protein ABNC80_19435 [Paenibacillus larvae]